MPDITHLFPIKAPIAQVFAGFATADGLDQWWTLRSAGNPELGATYVLDFGPGYEWHASISRYEPNKAIEFTLSKADPDWVGTRVGVSLREQGTATQVNFYHRDWPKANDHYHSSTYCWAMYLRILKRYLEHGETVPYAERLEV